jgi:hypothetical protein
MKHLFFLLCLTLVTSPPIVCQTNNTPAKGNANEVLPSLDKSADITLPDGREISIHPDAGTQQGSVGSQFFHRPINAFVLKKGGGSDHAIIHAKAESGNYIYLELVIAMSSPKIVTLCQESVIAEDPAVRAANRNIQEREIVVRRWPLKLYRLQAKHALTKKFFGEIVTPESLRSAGDQIKMVLRINKGEYSEFLGLLKEDLINFYPSYTFSNAIVAFGQSTTKLSGELSIAINNAIQSQQLEEGAPIFQRDARSLQNKINQSYTSTTRATDASVLAFIKPKDISDKILKTEPITFKSMEENGALLDKVTSYLAPTIRKMHEENEDDKTTTNTDTKTDDITIKLEGSASPMALDKVLTTGVGIEGSITISKKDVEELKTVHKVRFKKTEDRNVIEPHSIDITTIKEGWQTNILNLVEVIYLAVGQDESFQGDSPFKSSFTIDLLNEAVDSNQILTSPYSNVPRGVPMISFRSDIPKGWIALDGKTNWPEESWVPSHLQGAPVPNMSGKYVRGKSANERIGQNFINQIIKVPSFTVEGNKLNITGSNPLGAFNRPHQVSIYFDGPSKGYNFYKNSPAGGPITGILGYGTNGVRTQVDEIGITPINSNHSLQGEITIPEHSSNLENPKNQPPHVAGVWIMRIK